MGDVAVLATRDGIGIIAIDSPPVNALGADVRRGLFDGLKVFRDDTDVKAVVIICRGRTFFAGADISEFGKEPVSPLLADVIDSIEDLGKPVIAAIHGTALGGGFELALVCNYRVALPTAKVGLPEVKLGLLPGAGGTQRLPRVVGAELALDLMLSGRAIGAVEAERHGLIDALAAKDLEADAVAFAREVVVQGRPATRVRDRQDQVDVSKGKPELFAAARAKAARTSRGFHAPENIIKAVEAAVELPFEEGMKRERELFLELRGSAQSAAQRYVFFAEREAGKIPGLSATSKREIGAVGVIGAGTMGGGIAMTFVNAGIPVTLVEREQAALDRGLATIRRNYEATARKGRLTDEQVERNMALITPALDFAALSDADLVVEAAFESMEVKSEIFQKLDAITKPTAILASNTSFLDVDAIAAVTSRPEAVLGLHFFSPANVMRLLEVVRGAATSDEVMATAMDLSRRIAKVPVVSGVCDGFIANRIMARRREQAEAVILEGTPPDAVDAAIYDYGFTMGPFAVMDLVGLDVINRNEPYRTVKQDLLNADRRGQKSGAGYYDYDESRRRTSSPLVAEIIASVAAERGIAQHPSLTHDELIARLLYPVVNEGARILAEGVALRASDIDIACILGYSWPVYTGGPMFWADAVGLPEIVKTLRTLAEQLDPSFEPAPLLVEIAESGGRLSDYRSTAGVLHRGAPAAA